MSIKEDKTNLIIKLTALIMEEYNIEVKELVENKHMLNALRKEVENRLKEMLK